MMEIGLIRKLRLIPKFKTSQTGKYTVTTLILSNISGSKAKKTIKFGQSIEYKMRNIFLEKLQTKYDGKACHRPFHKKSKLGNGLKGYSVYFYCISNSRFAKIY